MGRNSGQDVIVLIFFPIFFAFFVPTIIHVFEGNFWGLAHWASITVAIGSGVYILCNFGSEKEED
jgi:hypothetical protein